MNRVWLLILCLWGISWGASGANVIREAHKTINGAHYEDNGDEAKKVTDRLTAAERSLMDALPTEKNAKRRAELYYTAALVQCRFNDIENAKIYLKREYDTVRYYNSIYNVYRYMEQCDSVERATVEKHQFHFRTSARKILLAYRPNLLNGGRFYMKKNSYTEAYRFLDLYLSSAEYPLLKKMFLSQTDSMYARVAYWITIAGYRIGAYDGVVRYAPIALRFPENQNFVQEYLCRSYLAMNDSAAWLDDLKKGFVNFPDHTYFFTSLQSYLNGIGKYDDALHFADRMVQSDPKNPLFWFAKAVIYMNKDYYRNCITNCDIVLTLDSAHINANYFKGLSYCNLAKASSDAMRKEDFRSENYHKLRADMMQYYTLAETPLENMRRLAPDKAVSWAPLLYQVYLHLNKGDEFDEMEHIVDSLVIPEKK